MRAAGCRASLHTRVSDRQNAAPGGLFQTREREILGGEKDIWLAPDEADRARLSAIDLAATLAMALWGDV